MDALEPRPCLQPCAREGFVGAGRNQSLLPWCCLHFMPLWRDLFDVYLQEQFIRISLKKTGEKVVWNLSVIVTLIFFINKEFHFIYLLFSIYLAASDLATHGLFISQGTTWAWWAASSCAVGMVQLHNSSSESPSRGLMMPRSLMLGDVFTTFSPSSIWGTFFSFQRGRTPSVVSFRLSQEGSWWLLRSAHLQSWCCCWRDGQASLEMVEHHNCHHAAADHSESCSHKNTPLSVNNI